MQITQNDSVGNDINHVHIDSRKAARNRVEEYIAQIHNPYCFKCGKTMVRVDFNAEGDNLENTMMKFFARQREI